MVPLTDNNNPDRYRYCVFDLMKRKKLCSVEPWPKGWRCVGSSHGWLILADECSYKLILREPFSGREIHLPPIFETIYPDHRDNSMQRFIFLCESKRYALSIDPDSSKDEFVLMSTLHGMYRQNETIAFFKSGNKEWIHVDDLHHVKDIVYLGGLFYVVDAWGGLSSCEVNNDGVYILKSITSGNHLKSDKSYLVESPQGDLLWVVRQEHGPIFKIYKLLWFRKKLRWKQVMSLGDVALFLGNNPPVSVAASDFPGCQTSHDVDDSAEHAGVVVWGCQSNSIYFSDCLRDSDSNTRYGRVNVFNLHDSSVTTLYKHDRAGPIWISPKFV